MHATALARRAADAFDLGGAVTGVQSLERGLINDTFVVTTAPGLRVILQRLNRQVFPLPQDILDNLRTLLAHVRPDERLRLPALYPARDGNYHFVDAHGDTWRALAYLENTRSLSRLETPAQARHVGAALGHFHAMLDDLEITRLHKTLPGFHVTPLYLERFDAAIRSSAVPDSAALQQAIRFVEERRDLASVLEDAKRAGDLRLRPTHGDPKLDNFLFDVAGNEVVSLIDLDTVQPGLVQVDLGDCLRSCCNRAGESPADLYAVSFDTDACEAILGGYLDAAQDFLDDGDYRHLHDAIRLLPFELGLRFLTDHFAGDRYFKVATPGQNLHRARVQFRLVEGIERHESRLRSVIRRLSGH